MVEDATYDNVIRWLCMLGSRYLKLFSQSLLVVLYREKVSSYVFGARSSFGIRTYEKPR